MHQSNHHQNQDNQSELGFVERHNVLPLSKSTPALQTAVPQIDEARELFRYLVILSDESYVGTIESEERELEYSFCDTAYVLARSTEEAFLLAADDIEEDCGHRPVVAFTVEDLRAMADALEGCPLSADRRSIATLGGYSSLDQLKSSVPAD